MLSTQFRMLVYQYPCPTAPQQNGSTRGRYRHQQRKRVPLLIYQQTNEVEFLDSAIALATDEINNDLHHADGAVRRERLVRILGARLGYQLDGEDEIEPESEGEESDSDKGWEAIDGLSGSIPDAQDTVDSDDAEELSNLFFSRYQEDCGDEILDQATEYARIAARVPRDHPRRLSRVCNLSKLVAQRVILSRNHDDLLILGSTAQEVLNGRPTDEERTTVEIMKSDVLVKLQHMNGRSIHKGKFRATADLEESLSFEDLDTIINRLERVWWMFTHPTTWRVTDLSRLYLQRFKLREFVQDLERELLSMALRGDLDDLNQAINHCEHSLSMSPHISARNFADDITKTNCERLLGMLIQRHIRFHDVVDLDRGIEVSRHWLGLIPESDADGIIEARIDLIRCFYFRFQDGTSREDLDSAIQLAEAVVAAIHPQMNIATRVSCLYHLGAVVKLPFDVDGSIVDLDDGIHLSELAILLDPECCDHVQTQLGTMLLSRSRLTGSKSDLDQAMKNLGYSLAATLMIQDGRSRRFT
ncbi:hypothetical protein K440DRAFT_637000 [Wilcoxina mikolae CBS 423.85]|nr:hypothetical protein K440DRAFT_637000 [Wilcoxina mikolae CBS 423.85]